jgi:predicted transport protein
VSTLPIPVQDMFEGLKAYLLALGDDVQMNPDSVALEHGFTRDVRNVGHWGTGDLEVTIACVADFERAKPLLLQSYEAN